MAKNNITKQSENFPQWYQDVISEAELADASEVRGCGIIRPYGLKIWELIKAELSRVLEDDGVENVYFPIFVPLLGNRLTLNAHRRISVSPHYHVSGFAQIHFALM